MENYENSRFGDKTHFQPLYKSYPFTAQKRREEKYQQRFYLRRQP